KRKDNGPDRLRTRFLRKGRFVSREIFIFKILGRVHSFTEVVLGENIGFSRRTAGSAHFQCGHLRDYASVNWASYGTPLPDRRSGFILCPSSRNLSECSLRSPDRGPRPVAE